MVSGSDPTDRSYHAIYMMFDNLDNSDSIGYEALALTLTSCSSQASVKFYEEKLKPELDAIRKTCVPLQELVVQAKKMINEILAPHPRHIFRYKKNFAEICVELDKVMLAMLTCVEECGGIDGKRYAACAIVACYKQEDVVAALEALGATWLTHFLFIC